MNPGEWTKALDGTDVLINLAGRSVNCRYTPENRRQILESRVLSTRVLGQAIAEARRPPRVWLNASSATIYRDARDRAMDERTGELGSGFSENVCQAWERELTVAPVAGTRRVALRMSLVLSAHGGVLPVLASLTRFGLGGTMGDGGQYVSWLHEHDLCRAVTFLIEQHDVSGPVNLTSPHPVPNREVMALLRQVLGSPLGIPAPVWALELGAVVLRTETELILKSRRVVPGRLLDHGFRFDHPHLQAALVNLLSGESRGGPLRS